ncbi:MAG: hypothetical protein U0176_20335 [Bacteroidia bacterium]
MEKHESMNPLTLDWGKITPDGYDTASKTALHIFSMNLSTPVLRELCMTFVLGKLRWYHKHLPAEVQQRVIFDVRGQKLSESVTESIQSILRDVASFDNKPIKVSVLFNR